MRKYYLVGLLFFTVIAFTFGQSPATGQRIQNLAKRKFQWMINKQVDSLETILDERLKYIHSNGSIQTKDDVISDLKSGKVTYQSVEVKEMEVTVFDATAIVTGKAKFIGNSNAKAFDVDLLFTEVYILKNKNWRLVSRHASKLP